MAAGLTIDLANTCLYCPSITVLPTAVTPVIASGAFPSSGGTATLVGVSGAPLVGNWIDMKNSDTFCNIYVTVGPCSGPLGIAIQTAPGHNVVPPFVNSVSGSILSGGGPLSGMFTDPTSGLAQLPSWCSSGGVFWVNSGLYALPGGNNVSGVSITAGYPTATLPFGPNPVQAAMGGQTLLMSGSWPKMGSGGIAFGAFQRPNQYVRMVLLSGATQTAWLAAGFISNKMTTGSGGGATWQPLQFGTSVNV